MSGNLNIKYKEIGDVFVFHLFGEIDETNIDSLCKYIFSIFLGRKIVYDFSGLFYINSRFIGYLCQMLEFIEEKNGYMYIANCSDTIEDILSLAGIFNLIPYTKTVDEALKEIAEKSKKNLL